MKVQIKVMTKLGEVVSEETEVSASEYQDLVELCEKSHKIEFMAITAGKEKIVIPHKVLRKSIIIINRLDEQVDN